MFYSGPGPYNETHSCFIPYVTLEHTLTGYIMNTVDAWCGQPEHPGINHGECPDKDDCFRPHCTSKCAFWQQASIEFAKAASCHVQVLLDGAKGNGEVAVDAQSYFMLYELPNLDESIVQKVHIHVMYSTENIIETCGKGSIKALQDKLNLKFPSGSTCKNFTGFNDAQGLRRRREAEEICSFFRCSGSSVGFNFTLLLLCTFYAFL
ncbi:ADP-ribosyl cyclase/cyclic ADP-ribose hydrolase-like [Ptychodera flava]|uniref:ADP-ribosyl cyclase/cyclic ADP-ribose hydrolase-like n=1 Tax=Ptychodera flava TaxID=63121 RepID=UPI00396A93DB